MTKEEKDLWLKDICARLPYGVKGLHRVQVHSISIIDAIGPYPSLQVDGYNAWFPIETFKPFLRPMSSMTEKERKELNCIGYIVPLYDGCFGVDMRAYCKNDQPHYRRFSDFSTIEDWLNEHHFDYRGLIPMGLALEAPEEMYKK